jgi:hypothetical protein
VVGVDQEDPMRRHAFASAVVGCILAGFSPVLAQNGDAAGHAQSTAGRPGAASSTDMGGAGPGGGQGSDAAAGNAAVGRTRPQPGSAPGGQPTRDPGQATEIGSPGTETNPGTAGPNTAAGGQK